MKHLGIILASIILVLALGAEAKNPYAKQIKQLKKELAQIEKDLKHLEPFRDSTHPRIVRERERLQNEQIGVVQILQQLDPNGDYSAYLPKSDERSATGNDMTENRAEPEAAAEPEGAVSEVQSKANPNEEITLTVTSDGATKDEAIKNALRTAIEQAYGAFVSANTTILNDELVKDEIVTVSNGSIKEYKVLSEYEKADGSGYGVTANATVSLPHLITYAKNHGSECEFAGNTFGMEIKMFNLQKENELKALYNMIPVVEELCKSTMHWELQVNEPYMPKIIDKGYNTITIWYTKNYYIEIYRHELNNEKEMGYNFKNIVENPEKYCVLNFIVDFKRNGTENEVLKYIYSTLNDLSIDHEAAQRYGKLGLDIGCQYWKWGYHDEVYGYFHNGEKPYKYGIHFPLRNDDKTLEKWTADLQNAINRCVYEFVIKDNLQVSDLHTYDILTLFLEDNYEEREKYKVSTWGSGVYMIPDKFERIFSIGDGRCGYGGQGLFENLFVFERKMSNSFETNSVDGTYLANIWVVLPLSEIGKYSSFRIEPKE